jgi:iron complex transport system substrate-binding protein
MTTARRLTALLILTLLALTGCASREPAGAPPASGPTSTAATFPVEVSVAGRSPVRIESRPQRIVSLSPTTTEMLFAAGAGSQVIAVDDQSNYPEQAPRTELSGFKPNLEAIAGYRPDLVVTTDDIDNLVSGLTRLKIPVLLAPAANTLEESYAEITAIGRATGNEPQAADVVNRMRADIEKIVNDTPKPSTPLRYYHELDPTYYTATSTTFIGQVYGLLGLVNIADAAPNAASAAGYPQLSAEYIVSANPDLVFLADTKCCNQNAQTVAARPGWNTINAVRNGGVVLLDDDVASRWGPRIVDALRAAADAVERQSG